VTLMKFVFIEIILSDSKQNGRMSIVQTSHYQTLHALTATMGCPAYSQRLLPKLRHVDENSVGSEAVGRVRIGRCELVRSVPDATRAPILGESQKKVPGAALAAGRLLIQIESLRCGMCQKLPCRPSACRRFGRILASVSLPLIFVSPTLNWLYSFTMHCAFSVNLSASSFVHQS